MQGRGGPKDVVQALVAAINAHDPAASRELFLPDAWMVTAAGRRLDLDGLERMIELTLGAFPDLTMRVARWLVDGNMVVTEEVMEATHRGQFAGLAPTGRRVHLPMVHLTTVSGDRIAERVTYHDTAGVLRQLAVPSDQL
ncbi:MAG TPA: ester cyclase [Acidimicrobiales bacterium]